MSNNSGITITVPAILPTSQGKLRMRIARNEAGREHVINIQRGVNGCREPGCAGTF